MNRFQLTHDRGVTAKRRRREDLARLEAAEREILAHAQLMRDLEDLEGRLARLGGFQTTRVRSMLRIEHVDDAPGFWVVGAAATAFGVVLWTGLADLGEPVFARTFGWFLFLAGVAALGVAVFVRRTRTQVWVPAAGAARLEAVVPAVPGALLQAKEVPRSRVRQTVVWELRALEGARVTVLPSVWDQFVAWVRRGA